MQNGLSITIPEFVVVGSRTQWIIINDDDDDDDH
jgi:hypothetical protein